ncbi:hypothetical protein SOVF_131320, partial [Spinacia oleracea]
ETSRNLPIFSNSLMLLSLLHPDLPLPLYHSVSLSSSFHRTTAPPSSLPRVLLCDVVGAAPLFLSPSRPPLVLPPPH